MCVQAGKKIPRSSNYVVMNYVESILESEPVKEEENFVEPEEQQIEEEEPEVM